MGEEQVLRGGGPDDCDPVSGNESTVGEIPDCLEFKFPYLGICEIEFLSRVLGVDCGLVWSQGVEHPVPNIDKILLRKVDGPVLRDGLVHDKFTIHRM